MNVIFCNSFSQRINLHLRKKTSRSLIQNKSNGMNYLYYKEHTNYYFFAQRNFCTWLFVTNRNKTCGKRLSRAKREEKMCLATWNEQKQNIQDKERRLFRSREAKKFCIWLFRISRKTKRESTTIMQVAGSAKEVFT